MELEMQRCPVCYLAPDVGYDAPDGTWRITCHCEGSPFNLPYATLVEAQSSWNRIVHQYHAGKFN